jgi:hypothetical protein
MYQIYYMNSLLHHSASSSPPLVPGAISTGIIFAFTYMVVGFTFCILWGRRNCASQPTLSSKERQTWVCVVRLEARFQGLDSNSPLMTCGAQVLSKCRWSETGFTSGGREGWMSWFKHCVSTRTWYGTDVQCAWAEEGRAWKQVYRNESQLLKRKLYKDFYNLRKMLTIYSKMRPTEYKTLGYKEYRWM